MNAFQEDIFPRIIYLIVLLIIIASQIIIFELSFSLNKGSNIQKPLSAILLALLTLDTFFLRLCLGLSYP